MGTLADFGSQYKGHAKSYGFNPVRPADPTPLLRQNQLNTERAMERVMDHEVRMRELNNQIRRSEQELTFNKEVKAQEISAKAQERSDQLRYDQLEKQEEIKRVFNTQQMGQLAQFSQSLSDIALQGVQTAKDIYVQNKIAEVFSMGVSPNEEALFRNQEAAAEGAAMHAKQTGQAMEYLGLPADLIKKARSSSGWARYAYNKAIMLMAGQRYNQFVAHNASNFTVKIGDKDVSLASAGNSSEFAAVQTTLRNQFLQQFAGLNVNMMNEHLFPAMRKVEERASLGFADKQRSRIKEDREYEFKSQIFSNAIGKGDASALQRTLKIYSTELGGMPKARSLMLSDLKKGLEGGLFDHKDIGNVRKMLETKVQWNDGSMMSFKQKFPRDYAVSGLEKTLNSAQWSLFNSSQETKQMNAKAWIAELDNMRAQSPGRLTNDDITNLLSIAKSRGFDHLVADHLNDIVTKEEQDVEDSKDHAIGLIELNGGFITEEQAKDLAPAVRAMYRARKMIVKGETVLPDEHHITQARKLIKDQTDVSHWQEGGAVKPTKQYRDAIRYGNALYRQYFAQNVMSEQFESKELAHQDALAKVEKLMINKGKAFGATEGLVSDPKTTRAKRIKEAQQTLINNNNDITKHVPGLDAEMEQFDSWLRTGKGDIPFALKTLTSRLQGGETALDFGLAQLPHYGYTSKYDKPDVEVYVDQQTKIVQHMMRYRPTETKNARAGAVIGCPVKLQGLSAAERALLCTLQWAEGTWNPERDDNDAYRTLVGGGRFESLNKHPDTGVTINTPNGPLRSFAAGAYQFMPDTYAKHRMPDFSEESQDRAALLEIQTVGQVDPKQPLTPEAVDKLAPIWASLPTLATGTSFYNQGGKTLDDVLTFYQTMLKKEREARKIYRDPANMIFREGRQQ